MALTKEELEKIAEESRKKHEAKRSEYAKTAKVIHNELQKNHNVVDAVSYGAKTGANNLEHSFNSAWLGLQHTGADLFGMDDAANSLAEKLRQNAQAQAQRQAEINAQYDTNFGMLAKGLSDVTSGAIGMLPTIGAAVLTPQGKVAAAGKLAQFGGKALRALPSTGVMGMQAAGSGINQALNEGADIGQAKAYGLGSAVKEVATELPFAGIAKVPGLVKINNGIGKLVTEGAEEALAEALDPYLQRATYNPNAENASWDDMLYSALIGGGTAGLINSGFAGASKAANMALGTGKNKKTLPTAPKNAQNQGVPVQTAQNGAGQAQDGSASKYLPRPDNSRQALNMEVEKIRKQMLAEQESILKQKRALEQQKEQLEQAEREKLEWEIKNLEDNIGLLRGTQSSAFDDALFNAMDAYTTPELKENAEHDMPMSERTLDNVSNPKVKAYQSTHPEVKAFFREQAEIMLNDLNNMIDGGREYGFDPETRNVTTVRSQTRATSSQIERLLNAGMTKAQIRDGLERIIRDNGAENTANAKKVETTLDDALANGYQSMQGQIPKNLDYVYGNADIKKMRSAYNQLESEESFANSADPAGLINELEYLNQNITERQQLIDAYSELLPDMSVYETMTAEELRNEMDKLESASQYAPNEIAGEMMARHKYLETLEEGRVNEFIENENIAQQIANMEMQLKKLRPNTPLANVEVQNIQKKLRELEAKQQGISPFSKATYGEDGAVDLQATADVNPTAEMEELETKRDKYTDKITGYKVLPRPTTSKMETVAENETTAEESSTVEYEDFDVSKLKPEVRDFYNMVNEAGKRYGFNLRVVSGIENDANGMFDGQGNILIDGNKMTDEKTISKVIGHEAYHYLKSTQEHKYIADLAISYLREKTGLSKEQLMQRKYDAYANGGVILDSKDAILDEIGAEFMQEILSDPAVAERIWANNPTLAERIIQFFKDMINRLQGKANTSDVTRKALDAYSRGLRNMQWQNQSQGESRYSIGKTDKNEPVVIIRENFMTERPAGMSKEDFISDHIKNHIGDMYTVLEDDEKIYIGADLPGEYTHSDYTQKLKNSHQLLKAKNVAAKEIGELIEISKYHKWDENTKPKHEEDAKYGWYQYKTKFAVPNGQIYNAKLLIRHDADGKKYLYDMISIKKDSHSTLDSSSEELLSGAQGHRMDKAISDGNILPENQQKSNTGKRYSLPKKLPNSKYIDQSDENLRNFMEGSAVVNEDGSPKVVYSGHGNTNLFGTSFDKKKATAGGFYFTANPEIASNYAKDKLGVKEYYENGDEYRIKNEKGQYKLKLRDIRLTDEQVEKFDEWFDEDLGWTYEDFVKERGSYDSRYRNLRYSGGKHSLSNVYWLMNELGYTETYTYHRKNGEEYRASAFEILMDEMGIEWDSYNQKSGGVFPIYLSIKNPIDTSQPFPQDVMKRLERIASRERRMSWEELDDAHWTGNYPVYKWIEDIKRMEETGEETYWATQVPTKARKILQEMGYDGIKDTGGKMGGEEHEVWIAFEPTQVKSAIGNRGTYDATKKDMRYSLDDMVDQYGAIPKGEDPYGDNRDIDIPQQTADDNRVSRFARTAAESRNVHDRTVDMVISDMEQGRFTYEPTGNQEQINRADGLIHHTGWQKQVENFRNKYSSGERMTANDIVLGERLIQEAQSAGDYETAVDLIADIAAIGTELGQAVQALSVLKRLTPEGKVKALKRVEERINADLVERGESPVKISDELLSQMMQAESQQMQSEIWDNCVQDMANQTKATLADKINAWRYLAMLSNPKTHARNFIGNGVMMGVSAVKRGIQVNLENRLLTAGEERYAELNRNVPQEYFDFAEWSWENEGKHRAKAGGGRYNDAIGQIEQNKRIFNNDKLETARKTNTELLEAEDMWFKERIYINALARYMHTNGLSPNALQSMASNASYSKGVDFALKEAYKGTFQEASKVANLLAQMEHSSPAAKLLMGGVMPFKKTPINILKRGVEYSPVGLMNGIYKLRHDVQTGKCTPAEAIDSIAAGLTGTGIMIVGYFMASMGWITAGAGEDDERKQWYDQSMGSQNYALVLPNGGTATIDWLAPSVMPLMAGAELYSQMVSENPANENSSAVTSTLEAISKVANPILEMSMLQGVTDALQSYNSGTSGVLSDLITSTATSYGGQFIPAPVGALARTVDDTVRSSYAPKDSAFTKTGEKFVRQQMNKIPFVSMLNEASVDVWGNEVERAGGNIVGRAFNNFLNPATYSSDKRTELDKKLDELYKATGNSDVLPKSSTNYINESDSSPKVYLSAKERAKYGTTQGQKSYQYVNAFVNSAAYSQLADEDKAEIISNLYDLANYQAKKEALNGRGYNYVQEQYEKVLKSKLEPQKYYIVKYYTDSIADNVGEGQKKAQIAFLKDLRNNGQITDEQFWYLRRAQIGKFSKSEMAACPYAWIKQL